VKTLKYFFFLLLIVIIGLAIYIAVQPNEFSVTRTKTMKVPAAVIYDNVIDYKNWEAWSSWAEKDPDMKITLSEKTIGIGGSYSWEDKDGTGSMTTIATDANKSIQQKMQFADFAPSQVIWDLKPNSDGSTDVTWNISGKDLPFGFKAYATLTGGMDKQIGPDYERSLEKLDSLLIDSMKKYDVKIEGMTEYGGGFYMYKTTSASGSNISQIMGQQYGQIMGYMSQNNITPNGMPFTIYNEMNPETGSIIMSNAIPIKDKFTTTEDSDVLCGFIPKTKALRTVLKGNYTNLPKAWEATMKHIKEKGLKQSELKPFEIYTTDPGLVPNPANWITEIYIPITE